MVRRHRASSMWAVAHESHVQLFALLGGAPAVGVALVLLVHGGYTTALTGLLGVVMVGWWLGVAVWVRRAVVRPLRTIAALVEAVREGDYSMVGRASRGSDVLAHVMSELAALNGALSEQRRRELETSGLLGKIVDAIDVAIFTFDRDQRLEHANPAGERLLGRRLGAMRGSRASALGLGELLHGTLPRTWAAKFAGGAGPWEVRRATVYQQGVPRDLMVLADLHRALREEERAAWQRLVRVLGHEINNSLAPIQSIGGQLHAMMANRARPDGWEEDLSSGLAIITHRSEALARFLTGYSKLARLPAPVCAPMEVAAWVGRVAALEQRVPVRVAAGPHVSFWADSDQLDQLLINLVRNAADAALETRGEVRLAWSLDGGELRVVVEDDGPGLASPDNLFVPFFTTKAGGTGIGLVLCQQIAEGHGGDLSLEQAKGSRGCVARLRLPVYAPRRRSRCRFRRRASH